jgi:hypothetical protein
LVKVKKKTEKISPKKVIKKKKEVKQKKEVTIKFSKDKKKAKLRKL